MKWRDGYTGQPLEVSAMGLFENLVEQLVEVYLTEIDGCAVVPQARIQSLR